jgi:AcrR family transcriptional regulator
VSRGALAHYFPTKAELVAAAGEQLIEQRTVEFEVMFRALPQERQTVPEAIDALWSYYEGPTFAALLELIVASRTDPELRAVLADGPERITAAAYGIFLRLFPEIASNPYSEQLLRATMAALAGIALQTIVDGDAHGRHAALRETFKRIGIAIVPAGGE